MGKKDEKRLDADAKTKKRGKKKRVGGPKGIVDVLSCPPLSRFYYELVVGNGIGDDAVNDAVEAYRRAWESRREKALEAAQKHEHDCGKSCGSGEHLILGPFFGPQDWRVEDDDPKRATTWSWLGFQSVHFCRKN